jgi:hypothetical protein
MRYAGSGRLHRGPVWDRGLIWARPQRFLSRPPTLQQIHMLGSIADRGRALIERSAARPTTDRSERTAQKTRSPEDLEALCRDLLSGRGEATVIDDEGNTSFTISPDGSFVAVAFAYVLPPLPAQ